MKARELYLLFLQCSIGLGFSLNDEKAFYETLELEVHPVHQQLYPFFSNLLQL
jgi:hypothetical protein